MKDLFNAKIVCGDCNKEAVQQTIIKDGFRMRMKKCPECDEIWIHPADIKDYENFKKLKNKNFQVKLRMVGNSYTVSIPREIIEFREIKKEKKVNVSLDEPEKITLLFSRVRRIKYGRS